MSLPKISADGDVFVPGAGSLVTSEGTWTWGGPYSAVNGGYLILLNGKKTGEAIQLQVTNGALYALNSVGIWWVRKNGAWSRVAAAPVESVINSGTPPPTIPTYLDGFVGAPNGNPTFASVLALVSFPAPWNIADVSPHYGVGPIPGNVVNTAGVSTPPAGVSVNAAAQQYTITGSNVTFAGWDFGTWQVNLGPTCVNPSFFDCQWELTNGVNSAVAAQAGASGVCTISRFRINGENVSHGSQQNADLPLLSAISYVLNYGEIINSYIDGIDIILGSTGANVTVNFCCIANNGQGGTVTPPAHCNQSFAFGSAGNILYNFCTFVLTASPAATRGLTFGDATFPGTTILSATVQNCSFFWMVANQVSYMLTWDNTITQSMVFQNNYVCQTGISFGRYNQVGVGSGTNSITGNIDMLTGLPINT